MGGIFAGYRAILAPMAGVTDAVFRMLCEEQGADLTFTEMVSAKGLSYANAKTRHLLDLKDGTGKVGVQLFGHEPETLASQGAWVEQYLGESLAYIDINMGCPARKIVAKGDGAALMKDPSAAARIVEAVKSAVECPVTAKFRRGWDEGEETCVDFAQQLERAGVDAVTVHGRYAQQYYRGQSERSAIKRVKEAVNVPVVGNGDVVDGKSALDMKLFTGCDAVMVARGAQGNPWVFAQVKAVLDGKAEPSPPTVSERLSMARRHARLLSEAAGVPFVRMRKHASWYVTGMPGASRAREMFNACSTFEDFDRVIDLLEEMSHAT